jgi:hypothetical protein
MLLITGVLLTAISLLAILRVRRPDSMNASPFGWMSERWLAEHRAAHPS